MRPWHWIGLGLLAFGGGLAVPELAIMVTRGAVVGRRTKVGDDGLCLWEDTEDYAVAAEVADAAGLDLETYTLARVISSEHGRDPVPVQVAIAWAVLNHCGRGGVFHTVCHGSIFYGKQSRDSRYAATSRDPHQREVQIAQAVLNHELPDPTDGATNFFSPNGLRALRARDGEDAWDSPEEVDARWRRRGLESVAVADVDPDLVTFYRRA